MFAMPRMTPFMKGLLGLVFGAYVLQLVLENWVGLPVFASLAFEPHRLGPWSALRVVAYPFVEHPEYGQPLSVLLSLLFLWWSAGPFETRYGTRRAVQLLAFATVFSAAAATLVSLVFPARIPLFGVSVWITATIAALAFSLPREAQLSFFGVLPLKRDHLLVVLLVFPLLNFLRSRDFVSLAADLAAIGAGVLFILWLRRPPRAARTKKKPAGSGAFRVIRGGGADDPPKYLN